MKVYTRTAYSFSVLALHLAFCLSWLQLTSPMARAWQPPETDYPVPKEANRQQGVPEGKVEGPFQLKSSIYPGTERNYWLYIPSQYDADKPACSIIVQDGLNRAKGWKMPEIFDNLIHSGEMPVTVGIFVDPGVLPASKQNSQPRFNRSFEYDSLGDTYARFLLEELLPEVASKYNLSTDPNHRALAGASSGAICAFNAAWERPDAFRRVISTIGTYVGLRGANEFPILIRKFEPKPLRVFLQDGSADLNIYAGDWWVANQDMLSSLKWAGYEVNHSWIEGGGHNGKHSASIMPEALKWIWSDFPEPVKVAPNPKGERRMELLIAGADWQAISSGHESIDSIACNAAGSLFFADSRAGRIYRLDEDNKTRVFKELQGRISSMKFGPDEKLYLVKDNKQIIQVDANGNEVVLLNEHRCHRLVTMPSGLFFSDDVKNTIHWLPWDGQSCLAMQFSERPVAFAPTADQAFMHVAVQGQQMTQQAAISTDGTLNHRQRYGYLHLPYLESNSGASGMVVDDQGRLLITTSLGVQVLDQLGRVHLILSKPSRAALTAIAIGSPLRDTLYVTDGQPVFARKLKIKGVYSFEAPVNPPKPSL